MSHALALAERGLFSTEPNPRVGCVFVKDGEIIAEGWHEQAGGSHAEVMAIDNATTSLDGADCFVTLEPCSHHGRTPPCAEALLNTGIKRLVVAVKDPNPEVAGKGIQLLKEAGIKVETGLLEERAQQLNAGFFKRMTEGTPYVRLKMGMSMDAKTAMASGESQWITCPEARQAVQQLRAMSGAIITGRFTVLSDNPSLNVRVDELPEEYKSALVKQPLRVVMDSKRSLSGQERIFQLDEHVLWVVGEHASLENTAVSMLQAPVKQERRIELPFVLKHLADRGINEVLVEAGSKLAGAFVAEDLVDEVHLFMAPKILGHEASGLLHIPGMQRLSQAQQFTFVAANPIGSDVQLIFKRAH
jgi:diaminohydroxyphosphoribosylaminopyrimidine deaminase/5-amino-6-(5-phosphoribosylamino)uracil reductase